MKKIILLVATLSVSLAANADVVAGADFDQGFESNNYGASTYSQDNYSTTGESVPGHLDSTYSQDNAAYVDARNNDVEAARTEDDDRVAVRAGGVRR